MRTVGFVTSVAVCAAASACLTTPAAAQSAAASWDRPGYYVGLDYGSTRITGTDNRSGGGLQLGWDFSRRWAAELSYASLGERGGSRLNTWALSGIGRVPLADVFDVYGRLGYARLSESGDEFLSRNGTKIDSGWIYGLGARYALLPNVAAQLEWTRYTSDAHRWSVGLSYKF